MILIIIRGFNSVNIGFSVGGKAWETPATGCGTGWQIAWLGVAVNVRAGVTVRSNPKMPLNENAMTIIYHKEDGMNLTGILNIKIWASRRPHHNPGIQSVNNGLTGRITRKRHQPVAVPFCR